MSVMWGSKKRRDYSAEKLQLQQLMHEAKRGNQQSYEKLQHLVEHDWRYKDAFADLMRTQLDSDKA